MKYPLLFSLSIIFVLLQIIIEQNKSKEKLQIKLISLQEKVEFKSGKSVTFGDYNLVRIYGGPWYHLDNNGVIGQKISREMKDYLFDLNVYNR